MKTIAEHNAEMAEHSRQYFPPDPGKRAVGFEFDQPRDCWIAKLRDVFPQAGFLNYDGKIEIVRKPDGSTAVLRRRDMTAAEFAALPVAEDQP